MNDSLRAHWRRVSGNNSPRRLTGQPHVTMSVARKAIEYRFEHHIRLLSAEH